jgi:hypothetical protein
MRFKNKTQFGQSFNANKIKVHGHIMNLLLHDNIDYNGYVKNGTISELWSYIYMLYTYNKNTNIFSSMKGPTKATSSKFINIVLEYTNSSTISKTVLIEFINKIIKTMNPVNPILAFVGNGHGIAAKAYKAKTSASESSGVPRILKDPKVPKVLDVPAVPVKTYKAKLSKSKSSRVPSVLDVPAVPEKTYKVKLSTSKSSRVSSVPKVIDVPDVPSKAYKAKTSLSESSGVPSVSAVPSKAYKATLSKNSTYSKNSFSSYKSASYKPIESDKCKKDLQKQIQQLISSVILTKMCLLKYIADIVDIKNNSICVREEDLSKQKQAYHILSQDEQNKYKKMFKQNRDDIMFYKDLLTSIKINDTNTCEEQKLKIDKYAKELNLLMDDLETISQKLYKTNL